MLKVTRDKTKIFLRIKCVCSFVQHQQFALFNTSEKWCKHYKCKFFTGYTRDIKLSLFNDWIKFEKYTISSRVNNDVISKTQNFTTKCSKKHDFETNISSWMIGKRCDICSGNSEKSCGISKKAQDELSSIVTQKGGTVLGFKWERQVIYRCVCGNEAITFSTNIKKPKWGGCLACNNQRRGNKNDMSTVRQIFEDHGFALITENYTDNKQKLACTCPDCGEEAHISLNELRRGRRCEQCAKIRAGETNLVKYGAKNPFQSEICKETMKETMSRRYGEEHASRVPEIRDKQMKTAYSRKSYTFPSGKVVICQGYEPYVIDLLLETYHENDIIVETQMIPRFFYTNLENEQSTYFPDMYIPKDNIIVEVKSTWTLVYGKGGYETNIRKFKSVCDAGYILMLYVLGDKGILVYREVYDKTSITTYIENSRDGIDIVIDDSANRYENKLKNI